MNILHPIQKIFRRHRTLPAVLAGVLLSAALAVPQALAQTSVWRVSDGGHTIYIGGTLHLLRASDYPLPEAFLRAYDDSDEVYLETDLNAMNNPDAALMEMMTRLYYTDGRTLRTVLNDEAYAVLSDYLMGAGIPMEAIETARPGAFLSLLTIAEFGKLGFTPQGVDSYFNTKAMGDGKPTGQLETVEEQIDMLAALGEGYESKFVLLVLRDIGNIEEFVDIILDAWRTGDFEAIERLLLEEMIIEMPDAFDLMVRDRNLRWLPQIEAMFHDADTEYVLVGALHLVGEIGLLELLREKGYSVEQL